MKEHDRMRFVKLRIYLAKCLREESIDKDFFLKQKLQWLFNELMRIEELLKGKGF